MDETIPLPHMHPVGRSYRNMKNLHCPARTDCPKNGPVRHGMPDTIAQVPLEQSARFRRTGPMSGQAGPAYRQDGEIRHLATGPDPIADVQVRMIWDLHSGRPG
jgi:hypothetical protein